MTSNPERVCIGPREQMIAEYGAFDPTTIGVPAEECEWLVLPMGVDQWDTDWMSNETEAQAAAQEVADYYDISIFTV